MLESSEGFLQVGEVLIRIIAFDEHVINIDLYVLTNLVLENLIDQSLIGCSCIFQAEKHHFIAINIFVDYESSVFLILRNHPDLVVAQEGIHEAEYHLSRHCIDYLINL